MHGCNEDFIWTLLALCGTKATPQFQQFSLWPGLKLAASSHDEYELNAQLESQLALVVWGVRLLVFERCFGLIKNEETNL